LSLDGGQQTHLVMFFEGFQMLQGIRRKFNFEFHAKRTLTFCSARPQPGNTGLPARFARIDKVSVVQVFPT
jgi:hypothetical protein